MELKVKETLVTLLIAMSFLANACYPQSAAAAPVLDEHSAVARKLRLPLYKWEDKSVPHRGNVVGIHGLTFYSKSFDDLARFLASRGYTFYAIDMRGFGQWKTEGEKFGGDRAIHFDSTHSDFVRLLEYLRATDAGKKTIVVGESLGANVGLLLAANRPDLFDGLILSSPSYKMKLKPRLRLLLDVPRSLAMRHKPVDWTPYIKPLLTEDPKVLQRLMSDNSLRRKFSPVELLQGLAENRRGIKVAHEKLRSDFPILIFSGEKDEMFCCKAVPKMVATIRNKNSEVWVLNNRGHLLLEHQPVSQRMGAIMTSWLAKTRVLGPATAVASVDTKDGGTPVVHRLDIVNPVTGPVASLTAGSTVVTTRSLTGATTSRRSHTASAKTGQTSAMLPGTMARKPELLESELF